MVNKNNNNNSSNSLVFGLWPQTTTTQVIPWSLAFGHSPKLLELLKNWKPVDSRPNYAWGGLYSYTCRKLSGPVFSLELQEFVGGDRSWPTGRECRTSWISSMWRLRLFLETKDLSQIWQWQASAFSWTSFMWPLRISPESEEGYRHCSAIVI